MIDPMLKEIQDSFLAEAGDLLIDVESYFLALEKNPENQEVLDKLFRLAHNLKGSGKAVGFEHLSHFSHQIESLLVGIRNKQVPSSSDNIQLLLECCDQLKSDIITLKDSADARLDHTVLMDRLIQACANQASSGDFGASGASPFEQSPFVAPVLVAAKSVESELSKLAGSDGKKRSSSSDESIRIPVKKIEDMLNSFGEQVILQSTLEHAKDDLLNNQEIIYRTITQLGKITHDLQRATMSLRMVGLKTLFARLERVARDAAQAVGKEIQFVTDGAENELDKSIVDALIDPLTHMMRNSVDHGIEYWDDRMQKGKPEKGTVRLAGYRRGGHFCIELSDDGRGLDPEKIAQKAIEKGLIHNAEGMSKSEIFELIFKNGFSTKDQVSDISGRGVGMNVVLETILSLKGAYEIESEVGVGTVFRLKLPLTLAIFNGMVLRVGTDRYVIPASDVEAVIRLGACETRRMENNRYCVKHKDEVMPILDLRVRYGDKKRKISYEASEITGRESVLVVRQGGDAHAVIVDEVLVLQKVVHKNLTPELRQVKGSSGVTILGDGQVALILDFGQLLNGAGSRAVA
jgi:two-component system chemotaxis sensor kinase CheA